LGDEGRAYAIQAEIENNPGFAAAQQAKVKYTSLDTSAPWNDTEEVSRYIRTNKRLPVIGNVLGRVLRPFDRAYTTAGNVMRHDPFYRRLSVGDDWPMEAQRKAADVLNKITGRGNLGFMSPDAQEVASALFISPSKIAGDFQMLLTPLSGPKAERIEAAKTLVRATAALVSFGIVVNATSKKHGVTVGLDPDSPDFLQVRKDNTRFDMTGGRATMLRAIYGVAKAAGHYSRWSEAKYGEGGMGEVALEYLNKKASPGVQGAKALWTGKNFIDEDIAPVDVAGQFFTPWNFGAIREAWKEDGAGMGALAAVANFWGFGSRSYEDKNYGTTRRGPQRPRPPRPPRPTP
jgi:hypothetical protein